jgi:hypothetical protein
MGLRGISGAQGVDTLTAPSAERNALRAGSVPRADALGSGPRSAQTYASFASAQEGSCRFNWQYGIPHLPTAGKCGAPKGLSAQGAHQLLAGGVGPSVVKL